MYVSHGMSENQLIFHRSFELNSIRVEEIADTPTSKNMIQFISRLKSFAVYFDTSDERADWITAISAASQELSKSKKSLKQGKLELIRTSSGNLQYI